MKASSHARVWRRIAGTMKRLSAARGVSRAAREAAAACALLAEEAADAYAATGRDGSKP